MRIVPAKELQVGDKVSSASKVLRVEDGYDRYGTIVSIEVFRPEQFKGEVYRMITSKGNRIFPSANHPFAVDRPDYVDPTVRIEGRMVYK
jgi:hypothetical protein